MVTLEISIFKFDLCNLQKCVGQIAGKPKERPFDEQKYLFEKVLGFSQE